MFEAGGEPEVVGVQQRDEWGAGGADAGVAGGGQATVGLVDVRQASTQAVCVRAQELLHPLLCVVGGAVVDEEDVPVRFGLGEDAFDGSGEEVCGVVGRDEDVDFAHGELCGYGGLMGDAPWPVRIVEVRQWRVGSTCRHTFGVGRIGGEDGTLGMLRVLSIAAIVLCVVRDV